MMMKHIFLSISVVLLLLLSGCKPTTPTAQPLQVMSFNIRLDVSSDSLNAWAYRKANVGKLLAYYAPDLLGMQEVLPNQMQDLKQLLPQYTALGVGRDDGKDQGDLVQEHRICCLLQIEIPLLAYPVLCAIFKKFQRRAQLPRSLPSQLRFSSTALWGHSS